MPYRSYDLISSTTNCAPPAAVYPGGGGNTGGGGGSTTPNPPGDYDPCDNGPVAVTSFRSSQRYPILGVPPSDCDPDVPNNPPTLPPNDYLNAFQRLIGELGITDQTEVQFLQDNGNVFVALNNYLNANNWSQDSKDFGRWAVGYLNENRNITWLEFSTHFIYNTPQYKLDTYIRNKYPKFSSIADGLVFFLATNPKVVAALSKYSGFSKNEIMELASNGSGPNIKLSNESWTIIANGAFNAKISENTIFLAEDNVKMFENNFLDARTKYSLAFSLMVTILHETVHYGRFQNGMPDPITNPDFGTKFEELGFGFNVEFKLNQPVIYKMYFIQ
ncbi:MAG TPA: hypothetical protein DCQ50_04310 [Chryseobacterium sp.]|nr:hypothetical protein [Chryseobacterium sp.]